LRDQISNTEAKIAQMSEKKKARVCEKPFGKTKGNCKN